MDTDPELLQSRDVCKRPEGYRTVAVRAANHLAGV